MKKALALLLLACLLPITASAAQENFYTEMPALLRFTQSTQKEAVAQDVYIQRT